MSQSLKRAIRSLIPEFLLEQRKARRHKKLFGDADYKTAFQIVHDKNLWLNPESKSGGGQQSSLPSTSVMIYQNGFTKMK